MTTSLLALAALAWIGCLPALAGSIPPDIAATLRAMGPVVDPPNTAKLYQPLHPVEPYRDVRVTRDAFYGPAPRNRLDIFEPVTSSGEARRVILFVHGGGFVRGDKRSQAGFAWDNVALWAVRNGFIGVNMTYRLAADAPWPAGAEDIGLALGWLGREIGARGGDPKRIVLVGHSAGAVHAATYVATPSLHGPGGSGLASAVLVSGLYDLAAVDRPDERTYFGTDPADREAKSPLGGLLTTKLPLLITVAELDPPHFVEQYDLIVREGCRRSVGCFATASTPGHNHLSVAYAINTEDTSLSEPILAFLRNVPGASQ